MNKIILAGFMALLTTAAQAQNCVAPSRCAELGYRDDVGKCSGLKTLLCPFDSNKAFCIGADGGSGFYTCEDFLEAIKEVDGTIFLSRGLECDMTGKATEIRFAEGLKIIGTSDQPKIEFINYDEYPDLMLGGRNTFENLRIINATISANDKLTLNNIQAETVSASEVSIFKGENSVDIVKKNVEVLGQLTINSGGAIISIEDLKIFGKVILPSQETTFHAPIFLDKGGSIEGKRIILRSKKENLLNGKILLKDGLYCRDTYCLLNGTAEVSTIGNVTIAGTVKTIGYGGSQPAVYDCIATSTGKIYSSGGFSFSSSQYELLRNVTFHKGATIIIEPGNERCPDSIGTWIANEEVTISGCPSEPGFTKVQ